MFKRNHFFLIAALFFCCTTLSAQNLFNSPESITYDTLNERYFVSNSGNGSIIEVDIDGNQSYFVTGLGAALGLQIVDNYLYCGGYGVLNVFDITTDSWIHSHDAPGVPVFLNGLAADTSGYVYASDYNLNKIFQFDIATQTFVNSHDFGLSTPNGLCFDIFNNRLLILDEGSQDIIGVDLSTMAHSTVFSTTLSGFDGLTQDNEGDYYMSRWAASYIYKIDSSLTQPEEIIFSGFSSPADISYDRSTNILAIPNMGANSIILKEMKYTAECDSTYGLIPFEAFFTGSTEYEGVSWHWDFGDGETADIQSPTHSFTTPGEYDVTMQITTTENDTYERVIRGVKVLADTMIVDTAYGHPNEQVEVLVHGNNTVPVKTITIPIEYKGNLRLVLDSVSTLGCRTDYFEEISTIHNDNYYLQTTIRLTTSNSDTAPDLPPGEGPILKLYFTITAAASPGRTNPVIVDGYVSNYTNYFPTYSNSTISFTTNYINSIVMIPYPPCCIGLRGNIDQDILDQCDISDLLFLVDYMFLPVGTADEPECTDEADLIIDGNIDISDMLFLVEFMFNYGEEPPPCS